MKIRKIEAFGRISQTDYYLGLRQEGYKWGEAEYFEYKENGASKRPKKRR